MPPGEYDKYVTSKQKLCTLDAKVRTVTAWLKCILQEFGTLYWTITNLASEQVFMQYCSMVTAKPYTTETCNTRQEPFFVSVWQFHNQQARHINCWPNLLAVVVRRLNFITSITYTGNYGQLDVSFTVLLSAAYKTSVTATNISQIIILLEGQ